MVVLGRTRVIVVLFNDRRVWVSCGGWNGDCGHERKINMVNFADVGVMMVDLGYLQIQFGG